MQVGFIDVICVPLYRILSETFPWIRPLYDGTLDNRQHWQDLAEKVEMGLTWIDHDTIDKPVEEFSGSYYNKLTNSVAPHIVTAITDRKFKFLSFPLFLQPVRMKSKISNLPSPHFIIRMPNTNSHRNVDNGSVVYGKPVPCPGPFDLVYQNHFTTIITIVRLKNRRLRILSCHQYR